MLYLERCLLAANLLALFPFLLGWTLSFAKGLKKVSLSNLVSLIVFELMVEKME